MRLMAVALRKRFVANLKELAYKIAETKNDYYSWSQYIEVCDSIDIKDARERLNAFIH